MEKKSHHGFTVVQAFVGPRGGVKAVQRAHPFQARDAAVEMLALCQKHEPANQFFVIELVKQGLTRG